MTFVAFCSYPKGENCAASMTLNKNMWELVNCEGNDMAFICEKDKGEMLYSGISRMNYVS